MKSEAIPFSGAYANTAASLLLYCHQVGNALDLTSSITGADLAHRLKTYLNMKPLAEDRSLPFVFNYGLSNNPLYLPTYLDDKISEEALNHSFTTFNKLFSYYKRNNSPEWATKT